MRHSTFGATAMALWWWTRAFFLRSLRLNLRDLLLRNRSNGSNELL